MTDTALAVGRRLLRGRSIFAADREHIHHLLLEAGISHRGAVLILYAVTLIFCGMGLLAAFGAGWIVPAMALPVCACAALALWKLGILRFERERRLGDERRRNRALRAAVKTMASRLRDATTLAQVLEALAPLPSVLAANRAVASVSQAGLQRDFPSGEPASHGPVFTAVFPFGNPPVGKVEVQWSDGRNRIDRDEEIALQRICSFVERSMRRIGSKDEPRGPNGGASTNVDAPTQSG
jgi:UDP-GlcNAc:undecaprenyl-phosphate GlcNAc-1-phosphate transferase